MSDDKQLAGSRSDMTPPMVIDSFRRRIRGIRICAMEVAPRAKEIQNETILSSQNAFQKCAASLTEMNPRIQAEAITSLIRESQKNVLHSETPYETLIVQSFLKSAFSTFDAFVGDLLRTLYRTNPMLTLAIEKQIGITDLHDVSTVDIARELLIEKDIESLLRESYPTQFDLLAKRFKIKTLTEFANWTKFIESSQRRNLVTHRDGRVNEQYLTVCRKNGVQLPQDIKVGSVLNVTLEYLCDSLDVIYEVGFKLGQVLWRKTMQNDINNADSHLITGIVEILQREDWVIASCMSEFAVSFTKPFNERNKKLMQINHAQALMWEGRKQEALKYLNEQDWTVAIRDLRLAVAVLKEEFDVAAKLMKEIGKNGELVNCQGYVDWPIFREFRKTTQFQDAFREVFGVAFQEEAKKLDPGPT